MASDKQKTLRSYLPNAAIALFTAGACLFGVRYLPFITLAENWVDDLRISSLSPKQPQNTDIVIVTVTEDTLKTFPYRSPLDRHFISTLLKNLQDKGVRMIGLDILFDQATEPDKDAELQRTLREMKIPVFVSWPGNQLGLMDRQLKYLNAYMEGINRGLATLSKDGVDGKVRSIYLGGDSRGTWMPGLSAAMAGHLGAKIPKGGFLPLSFHSRPDADPPPFAVFPAHGVPFLPAPWFKDKIVLIGAELTLEDRHRTPFDLGYLRGRGMPGVFIHAHSLAQLMEGRSTRHLSSLGNALVVLALAVLGILLAMSSLAIGLKGGIALIVVGVGWAGSFLLFKEGGALVSLVSPTLAFVTSSALGTAWQWQKERAQRRFIREAFSKYMAPSILKQLEDNPDSLELNGERREMTFLFTDIANFTPLTERTSPDVLVPLLNEYLDGTCSIVLQHGGTIDKIAGDALTVLFNAPMEQLDHAQRAVDCALELDRFSEDYIAALAARGIEFGITRIGINTGMAVVGNFGGSTRFNYTAHGDSINTAARLESLNKHLGTRICVSHSAMTQCSGVAFRPVGRIVLKGKSEPTEVFEPVPAEEAASPKHQAYLDVYKLMDINRLEAVTALTDLNRKFPDDPLILFHLNRLNALSKDYQSGREEGPGTLPGTLIVMGEK
ncbi:MAG: adenylate/guanylate cyclase domain-containing protein [Rhodospirillales bacterium]|nr:adenylate/guanylate cyclase domain-containing protein [Rhodospirillales bacterium]